jgi:hypothetical protein
MDGNEPLDRSYGFDALATLEAKNVDRIQFWCVRRESRGTHDPHCMHWETMKIEDAIARFGPGTTLVMLARRARCSLCGARGCHVQPAQPQAPGHPGHRELQARGGFRWP